MKSLKELKKEKLKEKETYEKIKQEEEELEKELNEIMPEPSFSFKETLDILKGKDEEELEYESYLTEEELKQEEEKRKEEIKIAKTAAIIISTAFIVVIVGANVFYNIFKSELLKVTEPMLKSHYEAVTGEKAKTKTIEELKTKNEENKEVGTGIYLLTTKDNKHIMSVNNELIGDDIAVSTKKEEVNEFIKPYLGNVELIIDSLSLSYDDYYVSYNRYLDYMNVLPSALSTEELISSNKLVITYKAIYQGDLDINNIENLIERFSNNSSILLFKQESAGITNVTFVKQGSTHSFDITAEIDKDDDITYLELDRNLNGVIDTEIHLYVNSSVSTDTDYNVANPISIKKETERRNRDEEEKPEYYLLRISSSLITDEGFVELSETKRDDNYKEKEKKDYDDIYMLTIGSNTYVFGENNIFIGQRRGQKSYLCKLGIC